MTGILGRASVVPKALSTHREVTTMKRRLDARFRRPRRRRVLTAYGRALAVAALSGVLGVAGLSAPSSAATPTGGVRELVTFAAPGCTDRCGSGSAVGPDGALYVTDGPGGRLLRIDRWTGAVRTITAELPAMLPAIGIGGPIDVAFRGRTAYVLVTLVGPAVGQPDVVAGLYRVEPDGSTQVVADIGAWSVAHPPATDFVVPSGLQYALQPYRHGFLVTDGHLNRVLYVTAAGRITEYRAFGNVAPTGLDRRGRQVLVAEAGPVPHRPETGRVLSLRRHAAPAVLATGAPLLVDVEVGPDRRVWALSQGRWDHPNVPENAGLPAAPVTGGLFRADGRGGLRSMVTGLDRPTSLEFAGRTAYVVTMTGKVLRISLR